MQNLLNKKLSRKEFVQYLGVGLLAATGISGIMKAFAPPSRPEGLTAKQTGYGASAYGR